MADQDASERDELEVIERRGAYLLGATEDHYVVGRAEGDQTSLERFPLNEEGYEAAQRRFIELRRLDRREGGIVLRALIVALWAGVGLWLVTGLGAVLLTVFRARGDVFGRLYEVFFFLDSVGFRLAVGPLVLLAGTVLVRGQRGRRLEPETDPSGAETDLSFLTRPAPRLDRMLIVLLAAGLALWILGGVATQVFREPLNPGSGTGVAVVGPVTGPHPVAALVEGLAFRVWVAAAVLLAVRWAVRGGPH